MSTRLISKYKRDGDTQRLGKLLDKRIAAARERDGKPGLWTAFLFKEKVLGILTRFRKVG